VVALALGFLVASQVAWGLDRTRWLYAGEPEARSEGREAAADWLARTGRADDVLFGYEPTYLDAWEQGAPFGEIFVPRADPTLALEALQEAGEPLGRGVWVLDSSNDVDQTENRMAVPNATPGPEFETQAFGPFLLVRTTVPTRTPREFLAAALAVQELGLELEIGDAGVNANMVRKALAEVS
jgi:hypothetical protein